MPSLRETQLVLASPANVYREGPIALPSTMVIARPKERLIISKMAATEKVLEGSNPQGALNYANKIPYRKGRATFTMGTTNKKDLKLCSLKVKLLYKTMYIAN